MCLENLDPLFAEESDLNKPNEQNLKPEESIEAMAWADLYAAAPADFVDKSGLSAFRIGHGCAIALPSLPEAVFNRTIGVREIQLLREACDWLDVRTRKWVVQANDTAPAVAELIRERNLLKKGTGWAKFTRDAAPAHPPMEGQPRIKLAAPKEARLFAELVSKGFSFPDWSIPLWSSIVGRPGWVCFIAYVGTQPAGSAAMFASDRSAWLGIDSAIPEHRKNGVQTALIRARIEKGRERGE